MAGFERAFEPVAVDGPRVHGRPVQLSLHGSEQFRCTARQRRTGLESDTSILVFAGSLSELRIT